MARTDERIQMSADAVVVGSGPNGLVAAVTLALAGREVLLLEAADRFGGGLRSAELTLPGRVHDLGATVMAMALASPAMRELDLAGVEFVHPPVAAAHPLDDRPAVLVHRDVRRTCEGLGRDAAVWRATAGVVARAGFPLTDLLLKPLGPWGARQLRPATLAAAVRFGVPAALPATTLGRHGFRTVAGRALLAGMAAHSMLDLRAPLTGGYGLTLGALAHLVGWPLVKGGSQVLADALVALLRKLGGQAVSGHRVHRLAELDAETVVLDVSPEQFLRMAELPAPYRRRLARFRRGPGCSSWTGRSTGRCRGAIRRWRRRAPCTWAARWRRSRSARPRRPPDGTRRARTCCWCSRTRPTRAGAGTRCGPTAMSPTGRRWT